MNFLAHLFLAEDTDESRIGSLLADFSRVPNTGLVDAYGAGIAAGVVRHRRVDAFTDNHERVNQSVSLLFGRRRHAARIVVDILYDHFLSIHWPSFAVEPLAEFILRCHATLRTVDQEDGRFPERFRLFSRRVVEHEVLATYGTLDGVALALERMSHRVSCGHYLCGAIDDIEEHYHVLERHFLEFFPHMRTCLSVEDAAAAAEKPRSL